MTDRNRSPGNNERAAVFIPATISDPEKFAAMCSPCLERIEVCGYSFVGVIRHWPDVLRMARAGTVDVIIVASLKVLPPDRQPRIEAVDDPVTEPEPDMTPPASTGAARRRPRPTRAVS